MKKTLSLLSCISLLSSSAGVISCSYVDFYKQSIENRVNELVNVSKLALYAPLAGEAGIDGVYTNKMLSTKNVNDYSNLTNTSTIQKALNSYFGDNFNIYSLINSGTSDTPKSNFNGLSDENVKDFYGTPYVQNNWSLIDSVFNSLYSIIGNGFSESLMDIIVSTLETMNITNSANDIDNALVKVNSTIFEIYQKEANGKSDFDVNKDLIKTNIDYLYWFYADLSQVFASLINDTNSEYVMDLQTIQSYDDDASNGNSKMKTVSINLAQELTKVFSSDISFDAGTIISLVIEYLPTILFALSNYIDAFDNYDIPDFHDLNNFTNDQMNHLLSNDLTNTKVIANIENAETSVKYDSIDAYPLTGLNNLVNSLFSSDAGCYNFYRMMQILFRNDDEDDISLSNRPITGDGTETPDYQDYNTITDKTKLNGVLTNIVSNVSGKGDDNLTNIGGRWTAIYNNSYKQYYGEEIGIGYIFHQHGLEPLLSSLIGGFLNKYLVNLSSLVDLYGPVLNGVLLGTGIEGNSIPTLAANLICSILSGNNLSGVITNLPTDVCGFLNLDGIESIITIIKLVVKNVDFDTIFSEIKDGLQSIQPYISMIAPYFDNPIQQLLTGDTMLQEIYLILGVLNIQIPEEFSKAKNIKEILNMPINVSNLDIKLSDFIPIISTTLFSLLQNQKNIINLLYWVSQPVLGTDDAFFNRDTVYHYHHENANGGVIWDSSNPNDNNDPNKIEGCSSVVGLACKFMTTSNVGHSTRVYRDGDPTDRTTIDNNDPNNIKYYGAFSENQYVSYLLGMNIDSSGSKGYRTNSFFGQLANLLNGTGSGSIKNSMQEIKVYLDNNSQSFVKEDDETSSVYTNKNNYSISNVNYTNFTSNSEPSTVNYLLHYKYNNFSSEYKISIKLDTSIDTFYHFDNIEKIS